MTTPHRPDPPKTAPLPKTAPELVGWMMNKFGLITVFIIFCAIQYYDASRRSDRLEAVLVSNAEVLSKLGGEWRVHDTRAAEFIKEVSGNIIEIKANTAARSTP